MDLIIFNDTITEKNYRLFVENIINVFKQSSYEASLLLSLKLDKNDCIIQLSCLKQDGNDQKYQDIHIDCNLAYFYDFLDYLVSEFRNNCEIEREDVVNLDDDHYVAFRMITKYNDLITIDGLTQSQAKRFIG